MMELELKEPSSSACITQTGDFKATARIKASLAWEVFFLDTLGGKRSKEQVPTFSEKVRRKLMYAAT